MDEPCLYANKINIFGWILYLKAQMVILYQADFTD